VVSPYRLKVLEAFKRHKTPLNIGVEMPTIEAISVCSIWEWGGPGAGNCRGAGIKSRRTGRRAGKGTQTGTQVAARLSAKAGSYSMRPAHFLQVAESIGEKSKGRYLFQPEK